MAQVQALIGAGTAPQDPRAQALATRWMTMVKRDTAANPILFAKLNAMHEQEPQMQARTGIAPAITAFVLAASRAHQLSIYAKYLDDDELAFMRANLGRRDAEWPPLIARVRTAIDDGCAPDSPQARTLALAWFELFRSFAGDNPATQQKIRQALENEPALTQSGMVDAGMRDFLRTAMGALHAG